MIASIALTFLIGERLAGYRRGFTAGLIHLCFAGAFLLGRAVTPEPVFGAFVAGAIFCAICGYQRRRFRRAWFAGVWLCAGLACLSKGLEGFFYLAGICVLLAVFFREARLRFRFLLHWTYLLLFLAIVAPWYHLGAKAFSGIFSKNVRLGRQPRSPAMAVSCPALRLVVSRFLSRAARVVFRTAQDFPAARDHFRRRAPALLDGGGVSPALHSRPPIGLLSMSMWSPFALLAALVWERTPRTLRIAGLRLLVLAGGAMGAIAFFAPETFGDRALPAAHLIEIASVALAVFALAAIYFAARQRSEIALLLVLVSMIPIGFCLIEGASRMAPSFSLAGAARFLNSHLGEHGQVLYEGPLHNGSSLTFYLNRKFFLVNQEPDFFDRSEAARGKYLDEHFVLEAWSRSDPLYLIIHEDRVPHWQDLITARVHIYHQVTRCGRYVVVSNQL